MVLVVIIGVECVCCLALRSLSQPSGAGGEGQVPSTRMTNKYEGTSGIGNKEEIEQRGTSSVITTRV